MTVFLITAATAAPCTAQTRQQLTHISGELGDTTVQWICIQHTEADHRINGIDTIPFCNGRFEYDLRSSSPAVFQVTAFDNKGRGKFVNFFAEGDTVRIKFHATRKAEWHSSTPLNKELLTVERNKAGIITPLLARQRQMIEDGSDLTPEGKAVKERLRLASQNGSNDSVVKAIAQDARRLAKEGRLETPEYKALDRQIESAFMETGRFQMEYSRDNPGPVGLLCLYNVTQMFDAGTPEEAEIIRTYQDVYAGKMQGFHLAEYIDVWCASRQTRPGGRYFDFTAPDLDGNEHTVSEEIKGKYALIDLWASWCGPCRQLSRSMIPVYEKYKDKGFTIVGVARERDAEDMRRAVKKDKYPWLNLLELRDRAKIWQHYGIGNSGGNTFLVDPEGKILAIHPTAEEVRAILEKEL